MFVRSLISTACPILINSRVKCNTVVMKYSVIATDYDGTLATQGVVLEATLAALQRYRDRGGRLLLVTGRQLDDLLQVFPHPHLFDGMVVENGAVLYRPEEESVRLLANPLPTVLIDTLIDQGVTPISQGQVLVSTWEPHGETVEQTLRHLGIAATVIRNKRAVMVLPHGVDKASGMAAALAELGLGANQVVGIGDAENDRSLLRASGLGVAVANAVPDLKAMADRVMVGERGAGVQELIDWLLAGH